MRSRSLPFVIIGVLGCLALFLLAVVIGGGLVLLRGQSPMPAVGQAIPTASSKPIVFPTASPLNKASLNLGGLTSYQATLYLKAKGTQGGQPFDWTYTLSRILSSDPPLEVTMVNTIGLGKEQDYSGTVVVRSGKQFFVRWSANSPCAQASQNQVAGLLITPGALLPEMGGAHKAGSSQVAEVDAERYDLSTKETGVTGQVWMTTNGLVVQANLKQDGALLSLGGDAKGHAEWEYALTSINKPVIIELPPSCRHLMGDVPLPADASDLSATDDRLHYTTATSLDDLVKFYDEKMKQAGWESLGTPAITNDTVSLAFTRKDEIVVVTAILTDNKADVTIAYSTS